MGESGDLERTFYHYGNEVDCSRYGAYGVFNSYHQAQPGTPRRGATSNHGL